MKRVGPVFGRKHHEQATIQSTIPKNRLHSVHALLSENGSGQASSTFAGLYAQHTHPIIQKALPNQKAD
jgi:hypothetical protein